MQKSVTRAQYCFDTGMFKTTSSHREVLSKGRWPQPAEQENRCEWENTLRRKDGRTRANFTWRCRPCMSWNSSAAESTDLQASRGKSVWRVTSGVNSRDSAEYQGSALPGLTVSKLPHVRPPSSAAVGFRLLPFSILEPRRRDNSEAGRSLAAKRSN